MESSVNERRVKTLANRSTSYSPSPSLYFDLEWWDTFESNDVMQTWMGIIIDSQSIVKANNEEIT